jgi:hypothetical protein
MTPLTDCTANPAGKLIPIQQMVDSIRGLKARPDQQIVVAGIFGWPDNPAATQYRYTKSNNGHVDYASGCNSGNGTATSAIRVKAFVDSFGQSGSFHSICRDSFAEAMMKIGEKVASRLSTPCVTARLRDMDTTNNKLDADCQVVDRVPMAGAASGYRDTPLASCSKNGNMAPCWDLAPDTQCEARFKIAVNRGGQMAPQGAQQSIACATCPPGVDPKDKGCNYTF